MLSFALPAEKEDAIIDYWKKLFIEPVETIYFIMKDGIGFRHSNQYEKLIYVDIKELKKRLKTPARIYEIKDIAIIIHNHRIEKKFSDNDKRFHGDLKKYGFDGLFLIYCHRTNETYDIENKKKFD